MSFKNTSFSLQKSSMNFSGLFFSVILALLLHDYVTVEILFKLFDCTFTRINLFCSSRVELLDGLLNGKCFNSFASLKQSSVKSAFRF